ncbi:MAG: GNAT family N-acetyltransferase [Hyphomicrobium sp.]|uniref:GNAT family N-acetyltransferase n=1 Tax=Hyphomicrobium sp. TaxID=82 RepID=UPI003D13CD2F
MSTPARGVEPQSQASSRASSASTPRAAPAPSGVTFDLVTTRSGFDALEGAWNDLFARAGRDAHVFQTFNWLWHWANHFLADPGTDGTQLAIVTAHADGRLVMAWPLVTEAVGPMTRLSWMGEPVSQYGDLLIEERADKAEVLAAAWDFVVRRTGAGVVELRKVRAGSNVAPLLAAIGATVTADLTAPYLALSSAPSLAEYEKRYSSSSRRNRKRHWRRLEERGAASVVSHDSGLEAAQLAGEALRLKLAWLSARGLVSPALSDPRTARFFADVARADVRPAGCYVSAILSDGRPVALGIGVDCKGRSVLHVAAYDLGYEKVGAGGLIIESSFRRAFDRGMGVFDLMAPGDAYKLEWADDATAVCDWAVPISVLGRAYSTLYLGVLKSAVKRGLDAMPVGLRRGLASAMTRRSG